MNWKTRATILRLLDKAPLGPRVYQILQRAAGEHRRPEFLLSKLRQCADLLTLARQRVPIRGACVLEVGSGWVPVLPVACWLCGAKRIVTYDLNRYLLSNGLGRFLDFLRLRSNEIATMFADVADDELVRSRLATIEPFAKRPMAFLDYAGIEYLAPADASATSLMPRSVDLHCSLNTWEHIPENALQAILREAARVLRPSGAAVHFVDPTDHFAYSDRSLLSMNFLRFSDRQWARYGGNRFTYHNRFHDSDYRALVASTGLAIRGATWQLDADSSRAIASGELPVHAEAARGRSADEMCRYDLRYVMTL